MLQALVEKKGQKELVKKGVGLSKGELSSSDFIGVG